jgi:hypothetical protein
MWFKWRKVFSYFFLFCVDVFLYMQIRGGRRKQISFNMFLLMWWNLQIHMLTSKISRSYTWKKIEISFYPNISFFIQWPHWQNNNHGKVIMWGAHFVNGTIKLKNLSTYFCKFLLFWMWWIDLLSMSFNFKLRKRLCNHLSLEKTFISK